MGDDREAQIRKLLPMVRTIARRIARLIPSAELDDLIGDGSIGLIRAVDSYDPRRGVPLDSYARRIVSGAMLNGVRRGDPVSERVRRTMRRAEALRIAAAHQRGELPSMHEMEQIVPGLARARSHALAHTPLSLDGPLVSSEGVASEQVSDPALIVVDRDERDHLARLLERLSPRQRAVLVEHYWNGNSLRAVSRRLDVSPQRISQLHLAALAKLRAQIAAAP
jgi:RNA polymerase sigma factor for flagellar operon FliA